MAVIPPPVGVRMAWESASSREGEAKPRPREIFLARKARGRGSSWAGTGVPGRGWRRGVRSIPVTEDRGGMGEETARGRRGRAAGAGKVRPRIPREEAAAGTPCPGLRAWRWMPGLT